MKSILQSLPFKNRNGVQGRSMSELIRRRSILAINQSAHASMRLMAWNAFRFWTELGSTPTSSSSFKISGSRILGFPWLFTWTTWLSTRWTLSSMSMKGWILCLSWTYPTVLSSIQLKVFSPKSRESSRQKGWRNWLTWSHLMQKGVSMIPSGTWRKRPSSPA